MIALENFDFLKLFLRKEEMMRELEMNPYVVQVNKFVHSLEKLSSGKLCGFVMQSEFMYVIL
mgnify:CR=1 FL=1